MFKVIGLLSFFRKFTPVVVNLLTLDIKNKQVYFVRFRLFVNLRASREFTGTRQKKE